MSRARLQAVGYQLSSASPARNAGNDAAITDNPDLFDLDGGNGSVGFSDLVAILDDWGPCGCPDPDGAPQSVEDCINSYSADPEKMQACIEALLMTGP